MIAPSILSSDLSCLRDELMAIEKSGADYIHFDVMDGNFVPNLTYGPVLMESLKDKTHIPFDTHLMVFNPDNYIEPFLKAGTRILTVQAEACLHLQRTLSNIRGARLKAGVALNPATPLDILDYIKDDLDLILIMTVNPGFSSQEFIPSMLQKIKKTREIIDKSGKEILLEVDGGINAEIAPMVIEAGADILVAGSFFFSSNNYNEAVKNLRGDKKTK